MTPVFQHEGAGEGHGAAEDWDEGVRARGGVLPGPDPHLRGPLPPRHEGVHDHGPGAAHRARGPLHGHEGPGRRKYFDWRIFNSLSFLSISSSSFNLMSYV